MKAHAFAGADAANRPAKAGLTGSKNRGAANPGCKPPFKAAGPAGKPVRGLDSPPHFFMDFRGPKAHSNRPRKALVCPTEPLHPFSRRRRYTRPERVASAEI